MLIRILCLAFILSGCTGNSSLPPKGETVDIKNPENLIYPPNFYDRPAVVKKEETAKETK